MNAEERGRCYRALLEGANTKLLVEIAEETARAVVERIAGFPNVDVPEP